MTVRHNAEMLRRWLVTKHTPKQDPAWLEAISSPECRRTDKYLERAVRDLKVWQPDAYDTLAAVYLGENSDPAKIKRWHKEATDPKTKWPKRHAAKMRLHYLEDAFRFILLWNAERDQRVLHWPAPEDFQDQEAR